jgi:hypothetical protein
MKNYLTMTPYTRVNDYWSSSTDFTFTETDYKDPLIDGKPNSLDSRYQAKFYSSIALDIVAETVYNYRYPYISEKTLRPIACKRMFIIVGAPNILQLLHSKGFKTFPTIINEEYDNILDSNIRWEFVNKEIEKFVSKSLDEIKEILHSQIDVLNHNFETLKELQTTELKNLK